MTFIFLTLGYYPERMGGAYRYVAEVAERLAGRGHSVAAIFPAEPLAAAPAARGGVQLRRYSNPSGWAFGNWRQENRAAGDLLRELSGEGGQPLVVLCHGFLEPAAARAAMPKLFLFTGPWAEEFLFSRETRGGAPRWRDRLTAVLLRQVERKALRSSARILTISRYYAEQLPRWHGKLPRTDVISAGVDAARFAPVQDREALRREFGIGRSTFLWLSVRRLEARMGLAILLEAFGVALEDCPDMKLWLAGEGSQRAALERRTIDLGIGAAVKIWGRVADADLPRWYAAADCTVLPSVALEGFGLVALESWACGTPVIGARSGAIPEVVAALGEEWLFPPGSVPELANALRRVAANRQSLPSRERCRELVKEKFSWERPVDCFEKAGRELRNAHGGD